MTNLNKHFIPNLKSISKNNKILKSCPEWIAIAIEEGGYAYHINTGWHLLDRGNKILIENQ